MPDRKTAARRAALLYAAPALLVGGLTFAALGGARAGGPSAPATLAATTPVTAADGKARTLADVAGKKATVLLFVGTECPISNQYAPEVASLAKAYRDRGVAVTLVYANAGTDRAAVDKHAKAFGLSGLSRLLDPAQSLADAVGATVTPEAVVLDATGAVRYKGRIDDRYVARGKAAKTAGASSRDLRAALDALVAGKPVSVAARPAVGCAIERAAKVAAATTGPTYAADVAPILQQNCQSCHRAGEIGPMPFETYDDAKRWAKNIASVCEEKQMPPWKPVAAHGTFVGERRLSDAQISTLRKWADAGAPAGDRAKAPAAPAFTKGWRLGQPDLVLTMPEKWRVAPSGPDLYRCFVLPTGLTEDKDVVAVEYRAGNKSVVHHVLGYIDVSGAARKKDEASDGAGYTSFGGPGFSPYGEMGGWAPGNLPQFLPDGIGRRLPANSDLVIQVHYHPNGKPEDDVTQVGLYFAKKPVAKKLRVIPVPVRKLDIPAGEANHVVSATYPVPVDATVIFVAPHMHLLGKKIEMEATLPDGTRKPIVKIDDWDFNWQDTYAFKEPLKLPKGSQVTLTASFDNTADNPRNPNSPPKQVGWGEGTTDEMCIGFLGFTADNENDPLIRLLEGARQRRTTQDGGNNGRPLLRRLREARAANGQQ